MQVSTRQQAAKIFSSSKGGAEVVWDNALMRYLPAQPLDAAADSGFPLLSFEDETFENLRLVRELPHGLSNILVQ